MSFIIIIIREQCVCVMIKVWQCRQVILKGKCDVLC